METCHVTQTLAGVCRERKLTFLLMSVRNKVVEILILSSKLVFIDGHLNDKIVG